MTKRKSKAKPKTKRKSKAKSKAKSKPKKAARMPIPALRGAVITLQKATGGVPAGRYRAVKVGGKVVTLAPAKHGATFKTYTVRIR